MGQIRPRNAIEEAVAHLGRINHLQSAHKRGPHGLDPDPQPSQETGFAPSALGLRTLPHEPIARAIRRNLTGTERASPTDLIITDHIVGLAARAPVPNRRRYRNAPVVLIQLPTPRLERRHDFRAASTTAIVSRRAILLRNVKNAVLKYLGNAINKLRAYGGNFRHTTLPLARRLFAIVYDTNRSLPKSK